MAVEHVKTGSPEVIISTLGLAWLARLFASYTGPVLSGVGFLGDVKKPVPYLLTRTGIITGGLEL